MSYEKNNIQLVFITNCLSVNLTFPFEVYPNISELKVCFIYYNMSDQIFQWIVPELMWINLNFILGNTFP